MPHGTIRLQYKKTALTQVSHQAWMRKKQPALRQLRFDGQMDIAGIQLMSIWIIAEYVGRIYDEVKQRPQYIVDKKINL